MNGMDVTATTIRAALQRLGLSGRPVCVHASLRSFGLVDGGAATIVASLLAEGCTILVPTFSSVFAVPPPSGWRLPRNGWGYDRFPGRATGVGRRYSPEEQVIDADMGAVAAAVLAHPSHVRGYHPLTSFTAVGSDAYALVAGQGPLRVYAPLEALIAAGGAVVLMGVGFDTMTLLHLAEQRAGRRLFRRWANGLDGHPIEVEVGGCSRGFGRLEAMLRPITADATVGLSRWRSMPAEGAVEAAADAIRRDPEVTHCDDPHCERCNDAVMGGPLVLPS